MQLQHRVRAQHAGRRAAGGPSSSIRPTPRPCGPAGPRQARGVAVANHWKVFGPSAEYSDGDAEFFRLTSQLSDQYEWFAPGQRGDDPSAAPERQEDAAEQQQRVRRPEFGLSPREIAALGLSGQQHNMPDPVRGAATVPATWSARHAHLLAQSACVGLGTAGARSAAPRRSPGSCAPTAARRSKRWLCTHMHTLDTAAARPPWWAQPPLPPQPAHRHATRPRSQATLSARHFMRGDPFNPADPAALGFSATMARSSSRASSSGAPTGGALAATAAARGRSYSGARAAYGDYQAYPEGRPIFLPEAERFGNPPDLPSLLLQQRIIYISMPVRGEGGRAPAAPPQPGRRSSRPAGCSLHQSRCAAAAAPPELERSAPPPPKGGCKQWLIVHRRPRVCWSSTHCTRARPAPRSPLPAPQFLPSVTELVVAQCYYLDFDDRNRQRPIYVYLNSTGCINEQGKVRAPGPRLLRRRLCVCDNSRQPPRCGQGRQPRVSRPLVACCRGCCATGEPGLGCSAWARATARRGPDAAAPPPLPPPPPTPPPGPPPPPCPGHLCGQRVLCDLVRPRLHARAAVYGSDLEGTEPGRGAAGGGPEGPPLHVPALQDQHRAADHEPRVWAHRGRAAAGERVGVCDQVLRG
jgi:hypothetical protein